MSNRREEHYNTFQNKIPTRKKNVPQMEDERMQVIMSSEVLWANPA
jgi:hypothetical protein